MPLSHAEADQVRAIARAELRPDITRLEESMRLNSETNANLAKVVERMSLVVFGDEKTGVDGFVSELRGYRAERQAALVNQARRAGIWIGASFVIVGLARFAWGLVGMMFSK